LKNINADNINLYSRWLVLQCPFLAGFAVPGDNWEINKEIEDGIQARNVSGEDFVCGAE